MAIKVDPEAHKFFFSFVNELMSLAPYRFLARGKEVHANARKQARELLGSVQLVKEMMIEKKENESANLMLCCEFVTKAIISEFSAYLSFKDDRADSGWDHFVEAERFLEIAVDIYPDEKPSEFCTSLMHNLDRYKRIMDDLFPDITFVSMGYEVLEAHCSICHSNWHSCSHKKGRAYMGELCTRVKTKVVQQELSIVKEPADKKCRIRYSGDIELITYHKRGTDNEVTEEIIESGE